MNHLNDLFQSLHMETKYLANIAVFELENKLLGYKINDFEKQIENNKSVLKDVKEDKIIYSIEMNITELELRIIEKQTKIKLNEIQITRIKRSISE